MMMQNSVIQLNDKEAGVIIGKGYVAGIAGHTGGMNAYIVSIHPIIKVDIKDKKIRVTYTVQCYDVEKINWWWRYVCFFQWLHKTYTI